jgi:aminocarboxymuconate-semialdehyde decarboxylase
MTKFPNPKRESLIWTLKVSASKPCRVCRSCMYPEVTPDLGLAIAQVNNDALAAIGQRLSARFMPLASVPLQAPALAARELERADQLGLRGVEIPPRIQDQGLDESQFTEFWDAAEALHMVVCIHPFEAAPKGMLARYGLGVLAGNLFDTGLAGGGADL